MFSSFTEPFKSLHAVKANFKDESETAMCCCNSHSECFPTRSNFLQIIMGWDNLQVCD